MIDIFVSYSRKDRDIVKKLVDVMKDRGWSVWWDPTIRPGEYYEDVIENALTACKCVIVVWSRNSVKSKWVRAEAGEAANRGVLVPVVIDDAKIPFRFKQIQEAHLSDWQFTADHPELVRLMESIAEKLIQAPDSQTSQSISDQEETEAPLLPATEPPPLMQQTDPAALDIPIDRFQSDRVSEPERAQSEKAQAYRRVSVPPQTSGDLTTAQTRPQSKSRTVLVSAISLISALALVGVIYVFGFRKTAGKSNDQTEIAQQNTPANQQANVGNSPLPSGTSANTTSPSPSPTESPVVNPANVKNIVTLLKGKWQSQNATSADCLCSTSACLDIQFAKPISDFCVESNQIYVSAYFKLDAANNKAYLFFKEPGELGAGPSRMPWDRFDRKKPLATLDLADLEAQKVIYVTWHGFTEAGAAKQNYRQVGSGYQGTYLKR